MPDAHQAERQPTGDLARQAPQPRAPVSGGSIRLLLPYGVSARMLGTVLPLERATSITTWKRHVASIGVRLDREAHERVATAPTLNEFGLPKRNPVQAVGIDVELTRFGGHLMVSFGGVRNGRQECPIYAGV